MTWCVEWDLSVNKAIIRMAAYFGYDLSVKLAILRMGKGFYLGPSVKSLVLRMTLDNLIPIPCELEL